MNLEEIRNVLKLTRTSVLKRKHVMAVGIGYKETSGKMTKDLAIICSVADKLPPELLSSRDLIPKYIQDVPTDVKHTGYFKSFQEPTGKFRPCPGGISIGHQDISAGTLGCFVEKHGQVYILSNNHVLANSNIGEMGDLILQPGPYDGGRLETDVVATLSEYVPISFSDDNGLSNGAGCKITNALAAIFNQMAQTVGSKARLKAYRIQQAPNYVDCAIAAIKEESLIENSVLGLGTIMGVENAFLGTEIIKSGRTTGITTGRIEQIDVSANVNYGVRKTALFEDQLMAGAMSDGGDSGSAVLNKDNKLVGLLFAGSQTTTLINKADHVMKILNIHLA